MAVPRPPLGLKLSPSGPFFDLFEVTQGDPVALAQAAWEIDPINGNDAASGVPGDPIASWAELNRRWGSGQIGQNTTVDILGNLAEPIVTSATVAAGSRVVVTGRATTIASGTLTGAVSRNEVTNQAQRVTQAAINWATAGPGGSSLIGQRMRLTANGAIGWLALNNPGGAGTDTARCSTFSTYDPAVSTLATKINPAGTEAWVVETLSSVTGMRINTDASGFAFVDLHINGGITIVNTRSFGTTGAGVALVRCRLSSGITQLSGARCVQCHSDTFCSMVRSTVQWDAGLMTGSGGSLNEQSTVRFRNDHLIQGGQMGVNASAALCLGLAIFDSGPGTAPGLIVGNDGRFSTSTAGLTLWGTGGTTVGIRVQPGGGGTYPAALKPNLKGALGDFRLGDATNRLYAALPLTNKGATFEESFT